MKLDDLTVGEVKQLSKLLQQGCDDYPWEVGKNYFIRTVTHHYTGTLVAVYAQELLLENAAWIADDGRFADALAKEEFSEVEPVGAALVNISAITDAFPWKHALPKDQK